MAVYKVAQDVEADDKILGPFSLRQFIYLIIVAISIALAWGLSQLFIGLAIIPLPFILFFGALALPLRKDQPMEVYLGALVSYYLKPRRRTWEPDGIESLVEITAPKVIEIQRTKDITETEAERRLSYLADIADTQGWAVRHTAQPVNNSMISDAYFEAQQTEDVLDVNGGVSQSLGAMINQADERRKQAMVARMQQATQAPAAPVQPQATYVPPVADPYASLARSSQPSVQQATQPQYNDPSVQFNPYPNAIHQSVIQPLEQESQLQAPPVAQATANIATLEPQKSATEAPPATSEEAISPDIINLASNTDLSIETIQREANRIQHKADEDSGEVFISLH
jgi:hypothetical protein